jgi:hypothetical protein
LDFLDDSPEREGLAAGRRNRRDLSGGAMLSWMFSDKSPQSPLRICAAGGIERRRIGAAPLMGGRPSGFPRNRNPTP